LVTVRKARPEDNELAGLPRLGLVIIAVVLTSQIRIEFLRDGLVDYQNYLFVVFALLLSSSDLIISESRRIKVRREFEKQPR